MNLTNETLYSPDALTVLAVDIIFYIDVVIRFSSALIHLFYFLIIFLIADLQNRTLIFVHHANLISFLFNLHYLLYFNFIHPSFSDERLNATLCFVSEVVWALLKIIRPYSVALIALYRLIAVFKLSLFKFINRTKGYFIVNFIFVYFITIIIFMGSKYWFKTSYGYLYCFDGFGTNGKDSLNYFIVQSVVGIIVPTLFTNVAYYLITIKLKRLSNRLQNDAEVSGTTRQATIREKHLVEQFFFINLCEIVSSIMVVGLGLRYLIPNLNEYYNVTRFLLRSVNLFFQLLIPIVSIVYNPLIGAKFKEWKDLFFWKRN